MLGIHDLDPFGLFHAAFGVIALMLGMGVLTLTKGTSTHRRIGIGYVASMVLLNITALWIFDLTGRFGPFHVAALVSLATLAAGYIPARQRRSHDWIALHGTFMAWSYVGLVAAFIAEIAVRIPGVGFSTGVIAATVMTVAGGALLIHTQVPRLAHRARRSARRPPIRNT
jgi:uncharacterized membrane protein